MVHAIVNEIKRNGGRFGLLMDGSQDITCQEQLSVVVRYVNDTNDIVERTILFINAADTSGKALYELLQTKLTEIELSASEIAGYSFDGAPNMRFGLSSYIQKMNIDSIYMWCLSHRFNLVIKAATASSQQVIYILQLAEDSAKLFRSSYVKMNVWSAVIKSTPNLSSKRRLKLIGTTRWSSKQDAINSIISTVTNFFVLIKSLLKLCSLKNLERAALVNASNILNSWLKYEHVVSTFILHKIFSLTGPTTIFLQKYRLNILNAVETVRASKESLENAKGKLNTYIQEAENFIQRTNNLLSNDKEIVALDCNCCIQLPTKDEKHEIDSRIINDFEEFIVILLNEIDEKILQHFDEPEAIFHEMKILDPCNAEKIFADVEQEVHIAKLCKINNIVSETNAIDELRIFTSEFLEYQNRPQLKAVFNNESQLVNYDDELIKFLFENDSDIEETAADIQNIEFEPLNEKICYCLECILKYMNTDEERKKKYENIHKIFKYVAILPSTQVKCERDFSKLKLIKNRLRTLLSEKSLENLMIISTESKMFENIDLDQMVNEFIASSTSMTLDVRCI